MKKLPIFFAAAISLFLFAQTAQAKVLPQAGKGISKAVTKSVGTGINISPRLRSDRRALVVYFSNLQNASSEIGRAHV